MTNLAEIIDIDKWNDHIVNKDIFTSSHPELDLTVAKYSKPTHIFGNWTPETMIARGLVYDSNYEIVARGFDKFFNYGDPMTGELDLEAPAYVMDKMDGSLGLVFFYNNQWHVSTSGSFVSDQAIHATKLFRAKYADTKLVDNTTLLVEVIYPENQIVTSYGDQEDLVLLAGMSHDGTWIHPTKYAEQIGWTGPVVTINNSTLSHAVTAQDPEDGTEGFVVRTKGTMVKIKYAHYLKLHKARFSITRNNIWQHFYEDTWLDFKAIIPDEFYDEAQAIYDEIVDSYNHIMSQVDHYGAMIPEGERKDKAMYVKSNVPSSLKSFVMSKYVAGNKISDAVKKSVK